MKAYKRILIIKMSSLGDVIHALPTLYAIRKNWPDAHITWAVHEQFSQVLPGKPWIDEIIYIDKKKLTSLPYLWQLRKELHCHEFDMCLDLQCLAKSALVAWLSGAKEHYGYWELREGSGLINRALVGPHKMGHVIERYLDTVRALGGTVDRVEFPLRRDPKEADAVNTMLQMHGMPKGMPYIVVAPGARWAVKEWPSENYGFLCKRWAEKGMYTVLVGSSAEKAKAMSIRDIAGTTYCIDMTGKTTLQGLIELIAGASMYVSADTGPLHIANALKVPLIALFGPTSPQRTGPYGGAHVHCLISPTSKATPEHPLVDDPECMKQITVDDVWSLYEEVSNDGIKP